MCLNKLWRVLSTDYKSSKYDSHVFCLVTFRFAEKSFNRSMFLVCKENSFMVQVMSSNLMATHGVVELMVMMDSTAET